MIFLHCSSLLLDLVCRMNVETGAKTCPNQKLEAYIVFSIARKVENIGVKCATGLNYTVINYVDLVISFRMTLNK